MTSVSVSYEVRRQLNTLRTMDGHRSVDSFLADMIRAHKLGKMNGELDKLRAVSYTHLRAHETS